VRVRAERTQNNKWYRNGSDGGGMELDGKCDHYHCEPTSYRALKMSAVDPTVRRQSRSLGSQLTYEGTACRILAG
jgi:hypothetical protein